MKIITKAVILASAVMALAAASPLAAADLGGASSMKDAFTTERVDFSGLSIGVFLGADVIRADASMTKSYLDTLDGVTVHTNDATLTLPLGAAGIEGGLDLTYRHHIGSHLYLGAYADGDYSTVSGKETDVWTDTYAGSLTGGSQTAQLKRTWGGFGGLELGTDIGNTLFFVRAGGAWGQFNLSGDGINAANGFKTDFNRTGWTVGGGLEHKLGSGWAIRSDYRYVDWGNVSVWNDPNSGTQTFGNATLSYAGRGDITTTEHIARVELNYTIGGR
jgi:opacity protein-like surface antigen